MYAIRARLNRARREEQGFTLTETLVTIAILGILIAIAIIIWLGLLERWRVDAAINQFAADMRYAHNSATNQLTDWRIIANTGSPNYSLVRLQTPYNGGATVPPVVRTINRSLPEGTMVFSSTANASATGPTPATQFFVEFNSDGTIYVVNGPNGNVQVSSTDTDPKRKLTYLSATSRIKIDP
jgi:prepilin-type N-terminal cleavage/methylation domain-containing protein